MRKYMIVAAIFVASGFHLGAQSIQEIKADRNTYIWGEGSGVTLHRANLDALAMIISQISVQVESSFTLLQEESIVEGKDNFEETFKGVINTYSTAALNNTESIVLENEPNARVFRFIKRADVEKIFDERERKIRDFVRNGISACESARPSDALRYYYWALTLLKSHPKAGEIAMPDQHGHEQLLITLLDKLIHNVFSEIAVQVVEIRKQHNLTTYLLDIRYKGKPAKSFVYSYWTGRDWTNLYSGRDGLGVAEFAEGTTIKEIRFKTEYVFENETSIDNELREVMKQLDGTFFRSSYFNVSVDEKLLNTASLEKEVEVVAPATGSIFTLTDTEPYEQQMEYLLEALYSRNHEKARNLFTPEGFRMYEQLLQYGNARIIHQPEFLFFEFNDAVVCRSLPMNFQFKNNTRNFVEEVVFHFDKDKKISSLAFGLSDEALEDLMGNEAWSRHARMVLVNFLENYKTAYALKRLDYLESIFDDNALIITGTVLTVDVSGEVRYGSSPIVRYNHFKKEDFIRHLRHSFASNEFINIRFEDNEVRKSGKDGELYGINIKQDYFSSNYGDSGFLFLMVDLEDIETPTIHVRTWLPVDEGIDKIIDLSDF